MPTTGAPKCNVSLRCFGSLCRVILFVLSASHLLLPLEAAWAEDLPTRGTFDGFYHQDRWGVGHFAFYLVDPALHEKLEPYEGKLIRLEVHKAVQPMNPGPAIVLQIGKITPLRVPPLQVKTRTIPANLLDSRPFQIVVELHNTEKQRIWVANTDVMVKVFGRTSVEHPDEPDWLFKQYTRGQLATSCRQIQMYQCLVKTADGTYGNLSPANRLAIDPEDFFPLVILFDEGLPAGPYEIAVAARGGSSERGPWCMVTESRTALDVFPSTPETERVTQGLVALGKTLTALEDGYEFRIKLASPPQEDRRIVQCSQGKTAAWSGRLRAFDDTGHEVALKVDKLYHTESWRLAPVPATGIDVHARFRKETRFSAQSISRLVLGILTDRGIETFLLAEDFDDVHLPELPPFGPVVDGVKLRARPVKAVFEPEEPLAFHLQAVNVSEKPVCWWMPANGIGQNVLIEIDGKAVDFPNRKAEYVWGWAAEWTCKSPQEHTITLPESTGLPPGEHSFRYTIISKGGTYLNANKDPVSLVEGEIASSTVRFRVEP